MATVRDIVTRALRMTGIIDREDEPSAAELRDGIIALQSLYDGWLVGGMFGRLEDKLEQGGYEAGEGQRIFIDSGTVTLPTLVHDRKPRDLVAIEAHDDEGRRAWIWDRTAWVRIDNMEAGTEAPLSNRGVNGLAACLALVYADEFGGQVGPGTVLQSRTFKTGLSYKFGSERNPTNAADYF